MGFLSDFFFISLKINQLAVIMKKTLILTLLVSQFIFSQTTVSGAITSDSTWSLADSPYILTGSVLVPDGVTLTIEAGVTVKFNSGLYIKNEGVITAVGTSSNKITFVANQISQIN